jgi:hypothetical protein
MFSVAVRWEKKQVHAVRRIRSHQLAGAGAGGDDGVARQSILDPQHHPGVS